MTDKPPSKADQVTALRLARATKRPNPFEDAARGQDPAPKSSSEAKGKPRMPAGSKTGDGLARNNSGGRRDEAHPVGPTAMGLRCSERRDNAALGQHPRAGIAPGPSEAKPKRGRPRIGEVRPKPWLECDPPMSKSSWYRRLREQR